MLAVWKYSIPYMREIVGTFFVPRGGRIVHVGPDTVNPGSLGQPAVSIWIEVDTEAERETRVFELFGTGHEISPDAGEHVGSAIVPPLALHLYERDLKSSVSGSES